MEALCILLKYIQAWPASVKGWRHSDWVVTRSSCWTEHMLVSLIVSHATLCTGREAGSSIKGQLLPDTNASYIDSRGSHVRMKLGVSLTGPLCPTKIYSGRHGDKICTSENFLLYSGNQEYCLQSKHAAGLLYLNMEPLHSHTFTQWISPGA